jgi:hypothetical protein
MVLGDDGAGRLGLCYAELGDVEAELPCPILPYPALSCPILPYPALSCPILPCSVLSCPTLPYPALPCTAVPLPSPCLTLALLAWASEHAADLNYTASPWRFWRGLHPGAAGESSQTSFGLIFSAKLCSIFLESR